MSSGESAFHGRKERKGDEKIEKRQTIQPPATALRRKAFATSSPAEMALEAFGKMRKGIAGIDRAGLGPETEAVGATGTLANEVDADVGVGLEITARLWWGA